MSFHQLLREASINDGRGRRSLDHKASVEPTLRATSGSVDPSNLYPFSQLIEAFGDVGEEYNLYRDRPHHADRLVQGGARQGFRQPLGQGAVVDLLRRLVCLASLAELKFQSFQSRFRNKVRMR
jgi:hypothetical protein